eukprot:m.188641 g.188641  ORF g.188641 m.188641 type:complete len:411 (-) comp15087_c0_seq2:77-1309(-)
MRPTQGFALALLVFGVALGFWYKTAKTQDSLALAKVQTAGVRPGVRQIVLDRDGVKSRNSVAASSQRPQPRLAVPVAVNSVPVAQSTAIATAATTIRVRECRGKKWTADGISSPLPAVPLVGGASCVPDPNADIQRVDEYALGGKKMLYPWISGGCGGVEDFNHFGSDGEGGVHRFGGEVKRLRRFGLKDGIAIDIGSHVGDSTVALAAAADKALAFDPNPTKIGKGMMTLAALNPSVDGHNVGVGDKMGTETFEYGGLCNGGIAGFGGGGQKHTFQVVELQAYLAEKYGPTVLPTISMIKTDLEGYDRHLLKKLIPLIRKICETKCPLVQVEWFIDFRRPNHANSRDLFDSLKLLPGEWKLYCTDMLRCVGKTSAACAAEPIEIVEVNGPNERLADCADIMAVPKARAL